MPPQCGRNQYTEAAVRYQHWAAVASVACPRSSYRAIHAIDLPEKALIGRDQNDEGWLTYNDPRYLAERHNLDRGGCMATVRKVKKALAKFAQAATAK
jgi:hypothetical protein